MKSSNIIKELAHHFPFTIFSAVFAIGAVAILSTILDAGHGACATDQCASGHHHHGGPFGNLFHIFHPMHILLSAVATTAMFRRFENRIFKGIMVGFVGSLGICGISDIILPYAGGLILDIHMEFHFCLVKHPLTVVPFSLVGIVVGLFTTQTMTNRTSTIYSHSAHVVFSTAATLLYLISYGFTGWMENLFPTFIILILAVLLPCCASDIFLPLLMVKKAREQHDQEGDHCCHH